MQASDLLRPTEAWVARLPAESRRKSANKRTLDEHIAGLSLDADTELSDSADVVVIMGDSKRTTTDPMTTTLFDEISVMPIEQTCDRPHADWEVIRAKMLAATLSPLARCEAIAIIDQLGEAGLLDQFTTQENCSHADCTIDTVAIIAATAQRYAIVKMLLPHVNDKSTLFEELLDNLFDDDNSIITGIFDQLMATFDGNTRLQTTGLVGKCVNVVRLDLLNVLQLIAPLMEQYEKVGALHQCCLTGDDNPTMTYLNGLVSDADIVAFERDLDQPGVFDHISDWYDGVVGYELRHLKRLLCSRFAFMLVDRSRHQCYNISKLHNTYDMLHRLAIEHFVELGAYLINNVMTLSEAKDFIVMASYNFWSDDSIVVFRDINAELMRATLDIKDQVSPDFHYLWEPYITSPAEDGPALCALAEHNREYRDVNSYEGVEFYNIQAGVIHPALFHKHGRLIKMVEGELIIKFLTSSVTLVAGEEYLLMPRRTHTYSTTTGCKMYAIKL